MGNRHVLSATGAVKIEHRLGQIALSVRRAQEAIAQHRASLCEEQAARFDAVELSLSGALTSANLSVHLYRSARPFLHPMDASDEPIDSDVAPTLSNQAE